jgi:1-phosphofructokinase
VPCVAVFCPHPLLTVTIEDPGDGDDIHVHAGGQGVWASRMAGELGAHPVLCGFVGGETGALLEPLLEGLPGERRLVRTKGASGAYVVDRRDGRRHAVAQAVSPPPSRHELDALVTTMVAASLESDAVFIGNGFPAELLAPEVYGTIAADVRTASPATPVLVDLSTPRLDAVLPAEPDLVKLNEWELAEYVTGPVSTPALALAAAGRIRASGARSVLVTRGGEPALWLHGDAAPQAVAPPRFEQGSAEGCGDTMMGAIAAATAAGAPLAEAIVLGTAAGAANFLHAGLGSGDRSSVQRLAGQVQVAPYPAG